MHPITSFVCAACAPISGPNQPEDGSTAGFHLMLQVRWVPHAEARAKMRNADLEYDDRATVFGEKRCDWRGSCMEDLPCKVCFYRCCSAPPERFG